MPENCESKCPGLARVEQQLDDMKNQNGKDHKEFREEIHSMEMETARQKERFERIMDTLGEVKGDVKQVSAALSSISNDVDDVKELKKDVAVLKDKPGKTWESIKSTSMGWIVALVLVILAVALGLGRYLGVSG